MSRNPTDPRYCADTLLPRLKRKENGSCLEKAQKSMEDWRTVMHDRATGRYFPMKPQIIAHKPGIRLRDECNPQLRQRNGCHVAGAPHSRKKRRDSQSLRQSVWMRTCSSCPRCGSATPGPGKIPTLNLSCGKDDHDQAEALQWNIFSSDSAGSTARIRLNSCLRDTHHSHWP